MQQRISSPDIQEFETAHIERVRELASECMVLLKNDGILPLSGSGKLALYGSGARRTIKGGTGSGDVNVRHFVNVEEGLENAGFEITTKQWLDAYDQAVDEEKTRFFTELRRQADAAGVNPLMFAMGRTAPEPEYEFPLDGEGDTAVYVLARISGEGSDRFTGAGDICLTETEIRDILALQKKYERFVLVLNTGGLVDLEPVKSVPVILLMGQLGTPSGDVLADVLTGKAYPSGKLTMTWAPLSSYSSTEGFGDPNDTEYKEGIYVGYRHFDTAKQEVTYPFGYGIGYTEFQISNLNLQQEDGMITVSADVQNVGNAAGKEVVQIYASAPDGKLDKPFQELAAYVKTKELQPSEVQQAEVTFPLASLASYDEEDACWLLEAGTYTIRVGSHSRNTKEAGTITLDEAIVTERAWSAAEEPAAAAVQTLPSGSVTWENVKNGEKTIEEFTASLTDDQLAYLCIGAYKDSEDLMEVIGNASTAVAGAAGETTGYLKELGLPGVIMADGPAGLRLSPSYSVKDGVAKGGSSLGGDMMKVYTPEELAAMAPAQNAEENGPTYYQYCVAIPIGTGIAQSWNDSLAEALGDLVGTEMELFGIHAWLAPALNIHRSPLCGRNFEYYSEDPVVSGRMAAAITKGVQKHPGRATTIKHFACNNQETNRYFSNSIVSMRAMREIYLKGFEICVKEAQPHFIMTSYNLINGEHACNRKDLLTNILRNEWGFEGVVMTDWLVTGGMGRSGGKWPCASAAGNVKAGNDITMPGIPSDKRDILDALNNPEHPYAITRNDLLACAKRVLKEILILVK